ncbi:MAG: hypothetical protein KF802_00165 [Bdellovibrionaceae bacterium]|nr:hypothetical protein [Pseudobdellovibrionaceae bacterium]MBX3034784.1 hypothetical protein [Pseudobdellovibrionaceae bacterium]
MDQTRHGANEFHLVDFITIYFSPKHLDSTEIKRLYVNEALSASQIAGKFGVSKTFIVGVINRLKIGPKSSVGRKTNPNNYRHHNPPYGYAVRNGKLVLNNAEVKICRAVVELMGRKKQGARSAARVLEEKGFKNNHACPFI